MTPENAFLVMEHCSGGELFDYVCQYENGLEEREARKYFRYATTTACAALCWLILKASFVCMCVCVCGGSSLVYTHMFCVLVSV